MGVLRSPSGEGVTIYLFSSRHGLMPQAQLDAALDAIRAQRRGEPIEVPAEPRPRRTVTARERERMRQLRRWGWTLAEIGEEMGRGEGVVRRALR